MKRACFIVCMIFFALGVAVSQTNVTTTGGTTNNVPKFSGSATIVNSAITEVNGKVGIGTTNPQRTLDVQGFGDANFHSSLVLGLDNSQGATLFVNGPIQGQFQRAFLYGTGACCITHVGTTGSSLGSTAGTSTSSNGAFFNSNGTADGDGNVGAQINTALPSWRMALGSGTSEWPGGDNFAIGRVAAGANYSAPVILFSLDNSGRLKLAGGIDASGSGIKHARTGGCNGGTGPSCSVTVSWPGTAFLDTSYTAVCTPDNASGIMFSITGKTATSVTVTVTAGVLNGGLVVASMTGVECTATHD